MATGEKVAQEAPTDNTAEHTAVSTRSWWKRKRYWLSALAVFLVLFAVLFGAIYGTQRARQNTDGNAEQDPQTIDNNETSQQQDSNPPQAPSFTVDISTPTSPSSTSETPTTTPSRLPDTRENRHLGIAADPLIAWDVRGGDTLWTKEQNQPWQSYTTRKFLCAPVAVRTGPSTQSAFAIDAFSGHVVYMTATDSKWEHDTWTAIPTPEEMQFLTRPALISQGDGKIDIINGDRLGHARATSWDGEAWSEWLDLGGSFTGEFEMSATSWGPDRIDVFGVRSSDLASMSLAHIAWNAENGWQGEWTNLGEMTHWGDEGAASAVATSWRTAEGEGVVEVVVHGSTRRTLRVREGEEERWENGWMGASHEGYEFGGTQSIAKGDGVDGRPYAHLISRGTDDCVHYNAHNGTAWTQWIFIYCTVKEYGPGKPDYYSRGAPTVAAVGEDGVVEVLAQDVSGLPDNEERGILRLTIRGSPEDITQIPSDEDRNRAWENLGHGDGPRW